MSYQFSRVQLVARPDQHGWLRDLTRHGDSYRDHALIWKLFPGEVGKRDFLFRRINDQYTFYVVSARAPHIQPELFQIQSKLYNPQLNVGDRVRFDLRANPTVSRRGDGARNSSRHDVLMDAKRGLASGTQDRQHILDEAGRRWLMCRASHIGLAISSGSITQSRYQQHRIRRKGQSIEYSSLDYQGIAEVIDSDRLRNALLRGVGHSKGFGCGLLLVKKLL